MNTHKIDSKETYLYLVKENIDLILNLIKESSKTLTPFNPNNLEPFYKSRAKHLQTMTILGLTYEHLIKRILIKRSFSIFEVDCVQNSNNKIKIKYLEKTISFNKLIKMFLSSNNDNYFKKLKTYEFNKEATGFQYEYMGQKKIEPSKFIYLIQKIRNNYVHHVDAGSEWNGIIWYSINYLIWLAKKEFNNYFDEYEYIGNEDIQSLFEKLT